MRRENTLTFAISRPNNHIETHNQGVRLLLTPLFNKSAFVFSRS